jgi:hypothetical protein
MQEQLFYNSDPNIICTISEDATIITAENITDEVFTNLEFVSNTLEYDAAPMNIIDLEVYLTDKTTGIINEEPTLVPGLLELVKTQYTYSDSIAIKSRKKTHKPFASVAATPTISSSAINNKIKSHTQSNNMERLIYEVETHEHTNINATSKELINILTAASQVNNIMLPASTEATTDKVSFIGGFKNGQTVSQIIDAISTVSRRMPDTSKYNKKYTLILHKMIKKTETTEKEKWGEDLNTVVDTFSKLGYNKETELDWVENNAKVPIARAMARSLPKKNLAATRVAARVSETRVAAPRTSSKPIL